jgi:polyisoprenoid-binding protein YceI
MKVGRVSGRFQQSGREYRQRDAGARGWPALVAITLAGVFYLFALPLSAQDTTYQVDPATTSVNFTVGDVLHTVHGTFKLKHGELQLQSAGKMSGEIVVDAASGNSGSAMRDRKMHKEVLESKKYPEINFRPDRFDGNVAEHGKSTVMVHGLFAIHGTEREISVPAQVEMDGDHWTANVHFTIPYAKWGMKNPSTLFLRVSDTVTIDLQTGGSITRNAAVSSQ